jgi:holo-[acyl-carrier protein] synthase
MNSVIIGIGIDLIEIQRIQSAYDRYRSRFLNRIFTPTEQSYCLSKKYPHPSLAGRFAAKEAIIKAFSYGFGGRWKWTQIEVIRDLHGKPDIQLAGIFETLRLQREIAKIHLSIAHSKHSATAMVILETNYGEINSVQGRS